MKEISLFLNTGLTTAKKSPKTFVIIIKTLQNTTKMMWKCRNCHLLETNAKFHDFLGGPYPQTSLEACTLGTCKSAFGAKKYSLFSFKRGCNLCTCKLNWARDFKKNSNNLNFFCLSTPPWLTPLHQSHSDSS